MEQEVATLEETAEGVLVSKVRGLGTTLKLEEIRGKVTTRTRADVRRYPFRKDRVEKTHPNLFLQTEGGTELELHVDTFTQFCCSRPGTYLVGTWYAVPEIETRRRIFGLRDEGGDWLAVRRDVRDTAVDDIQVTYGCRHEFITAVGGLLVTGLVLYPMAYSALVSGEDPGPYLAFFFWLTDLGTASLLRDLFFGSLWALLFPLLWGVSSAFIAGLLSEFRRDWRRGPDGRLERHAEAVRDTADEVFAARGRLPKTRVPEHTT